MLVSINYKLANDAYALCCCCTVPNMWIAWTCAGSPHEIRADTQLWPMCAQVCRMSGVSHMKYV